MKIHLVGLRAQHARLQSGLPGGQALRVWALPGAGRQRDRPPWHPQVLELKLAREQAQALIAQCRRLEPHIGIVASEIGQSGDLCRQAYEAGADACFAQALDPAELDALCLAMARRMFDGHLRQELRGVQLDVRKQQVEGPGGWAHLSPLEARVLKAFLLAPEHTLRFERLSALAGGGVPVGSRLSVMICRIRQKLRRAGADGRCITSLRGIGYQLSCLLQMA